MAAAWKILLFGTQTMETRRLERRLLLIIQEKGGGLEQVAMVEGEALKFWIHEDGGSNRYA